MTQPYKIWIEQCKAARAIEEEFGVPKSSSGVLAIRQGNWKLIPHLGSGGFTKPSMIKPKTGEPVGQLYNLAADPKETQNLYAEKPDIVRRLAARLARYKSGPRSCPLMGNTTRTCHHETAFRHNSPAFRPLDQ